MMMGMCNKQYLRNFWNWIHEKGKQYWGWVEKSVAYKKSVYFLSKFENRTKKFLFRLGVIAS